MINLSFELFILLQANTQIYEFIINSFILEWKSSLNISNSLYKEQLMVLPFFCSLQTTNEQHLNCNNSSNPLHPLTLAKKFLSHIHFPTLLVLILLYRHVMRTHFVL